jgi:hypothetical protein
MGQSTFKPGRKLPDTPADICEPAEALGIKKFGVMRWSGKGRKAYQVNQMRRKKLPSLLEIATERVKQMDELLAQLEAETFGYF